MLLQLSPKMEAYMKYLAGMAAGLLTVAAAGAGLAAKNDHVTKKLDLTGFEKIDISGVYELDVQVGPDFSIELSGDEDEMELVEASVKNGVLRLGRAERKRRGFGINRDHDSLEATITLPALTALEVSGVVDGRISGIDAERFDVDISGVGDMELEGECGELDADVSGVGDLDAEELECRSVDVDVSGVGSASVFASEEVDARISGMGDIDVFGNPERVRKDSGMFADVTVH
jgi:hypothetical protein